MIMSSMMHKYFGLLKRGFPFAAIYSLAGTAGWLVAVDFEPTVIGILPVFYTGMVFFAGPFAITMLDRPQGSGSD